MTLNSCPLLIFNSTLRVLGWQSQKDQMWWTTVWIQIIEKLHLNGFIFPAKSKKKRKKKKKKIFADVPFARCRSLTHWVGWGYECIALVWSEYINHWKYHPYSPYYIQLMYIQIFIQMYTLSQANNALKGRTRGRWGDVNTSTRWTVGLWFFFSVKTQENKDISALSDVISVLGICGVVTSLCSSCSFLITHR